jgi:hypothetical protein
MKPDQLYEELEQILTKLGVEVREDPIDEGVNSRGGLCNIKGRTLLIVNRNLTLPEKNELIIQSIQSFDLENIYLKPYVRNIIEHKVVSNKLHR